MQLSNPVAALISVPLQFNYDRDRRRAPEHLLLAEGADGLGLDLGRRPRAAAADRLERPAGHRQVGCGADVSATFLQPFLTYTTPTQWTFSFNTESSCDWENERCRGVRNPDHGDAAVPPVIASTTWRCPHQLPAASSYLACAAEAHVPERKILGYLLADNQAVLRNYSITPTRVPADIRDASHPAPIWRAPRGARRSDGGSVLSQTARPPTEGPAHARTERHVRASVVVVTHP